MRCLVTGSNGFVGSWLVKALVAEGHDVHAMCRKTSGRALLEGVDCTVVFGDMTDSESLGALLPEVEVVFHCAAALGAPNQEAFDAINAGGVANLVDAIRSSHPGLKRVVLISSIAAGGPSAPSRPRTEADQAEPISQYGRSKYKGEEEIWNLSDTSVEITIVRPPIVYGPGSWGLVPLFKAVKGRVMVEAGGPDRPLSYVYVEDLVQGIVLAGMRPEAAGEVFNIIGPEDGTFLDFQRVLARQMNLRAFALRPAPFLMKFIGVSADIFQKLSGQTHAFGSDKVTEALAASWAVSGEKAKEMLGYEGSTEFEVGLKKTLEDFEKRDWL